MSGQYRLSEMKAELPSSNSPFFIDCSIEHEETCEESVSLIGEILNTEGRFRFKWDNLSKSVIMCYLPEVPDFVQSCKYDQVLHYNPLLAPGLQVANSIHHQTKGNYTKIPLEPFLNIMAERNKGREPFTTLPPYGSDIMEDTPIGKIAEKLGYRLLETGPISKVTRKNGSILGNQNPKTSSGLPSIGFNDCIHYTLSYANITQLTDNRAATEATMRAMAYYERLYIMFGQVPTFSMEFVMARENPLNCMMQHFSVRERNFPIGRHQFIFCCRSEDGYDTYMLETADCGEHKSMKSCACYTFCWSYRGFFEQKSDLFSTVDSVDCLRYNADLRRLSEGKQGLYGDHGDEISSNFRL